MYRLLKGVYGTPEVSAEPGCDLYVRWSFGLKGWLQLRREGALKLNLLISFTVVGSIGRLFVIVYSFCLSPFICVLVMAYFFWSLFFNPMFSSFGAPPPCKFIWSLDGCRSAMLWLCSLHCIIFLDSLVD